MWIFSCWIQLHFCSCHITSEGVRSGWIQHESQNFIVHHGWILCELGCWSLIHKAFSSGMSGDRVTDFRHHDWIWPTCIKTLNGSITLPKSLIHKEFILSILPENRHFQLKFPNQPSWIRLLFCHWIQPHYSRRCT